MLIEWAIERGRKTRPKLKIGICGEHGGDGESVKFCHRAGMNYVSASPFRVPIARLAAAQAVIEGKKQPAQTLAHDARDRSSAGPRFGKSLRSAAANAPGIEPRRRPASRRRCAGVHEVRDALSRRLSA